MASEMQTHNKDKARVDHRSLKPAARDPNSPVWGDTHPATIIQGAQLDPRTLTPRDLQQLQRTIGNQAVGRLLSQNTRRRPDSGAQLSGLSHSTPLASTSSPTNYTTGGKKPGGQIQEGEVIGGRTWGEFFGDIGRPIGSALGNVVGSVAGALTGISISSSSLVGPTWNDHGHFDWGAMFKVTGGQAGWIVQEIVNTYRAKDKDGKDVKPAYTPHYWEAWAVDKKGKIDPRFVDARGCDDWVRPGRGDDTEGHWSMKGKVHFTTTDPATQGFTHGGVRDAGGLLATTSAPSDLGVARLRRYAQGTWDSTGDKPTHTGSAGP
jgi:hypothetical protein